jgi:hypothetical protein
MKELLYISNFFRYFTRFIFSGILPAEIYWNVLERIASHGYVVLGIW